MTRGERLRRLWIVAAGVLALSITAALAVIGVAPDGGHAWHSIQVAMSAAADGINITGGHAWH